MFETASSVTLHFHRQWFAMRAWLFLPCNWEELCHLLVNLCELSPQLAAASVRLRCLIHRWPEIRHCLVVSSCAIIQTLGRMIMLLTFTSFKLLKTSIEA